ncbi:MAG: hypothetical protein K0R84_2646 [Clostridia bacterium]|nr:hypothetical protein [Clostridia bacterium]
MLDFIAYPIGMFLKLIYNTLAFHNYGISIIILTIVVKALLLPSSIKQYRSTVRLIEIQPQMKEIQKLYANDQQKQSQEMMKLYQENKVNPAGGCLPLLIQMPILFSLYYVISQPLKYMFRIPKDVIQTLFEMIPAGAERMATMRDLSIINYFTNNPDQLSNAKDLIAQDQLLNMRFFGVNLGAIPSLDFSKLFAGTPDIQAWLLLLIPLLAVTTTYFSVSYSMKQTAQTGSNQAANSMQKNMAIISPLMTGFIAFTVPAGLGLYWIVSNVLSILQQLYMNIFIKKAKKADNNTNNELPA